MSRPSSPTLSSHNSTKEFDASVRGATSLGLDFDAYYESNGGRLVVDPSEAKIEFGEDVASSLKLTPDGKTVLWPQPTDDPEDPQNWSDRRKAVQMFIITLAAVVPDFFNATGIPAIFAVAKQFKTTTGEVNNLSHNWSVFIIGWGGIFAVIVMRRYGRLPVLFWSQVLALGFQLGCALAPTLRVYAAMRCVGGFFGTTSQVTGLYVVTDMYPFHLQARMLNIWTMGFVLSPFLSSFVFGFLVSRANWRWAYGVDCIYGAIVVLAIAILGEETVFERPRRKPNVVPVIRSAFRRRLENVLGVTGVRMAQFRTPWREACVVWFILAWRPHVIGILFFESLLFGFSVGIVGTNQIILSQSRPIGYGFDGIQIAGCYATPVVAVILGEIICRYLNDWVMNVCVRRNRGVFEAESRLWACYFAIIFFTAGMVLIGAAFEKHLNIAAFIVGWGLVVVAAMINTTVVYAYLNDSFPRHKGEMSAFLSLARVLFGFCVAFFQVPWTTKHGALQSFGCEAAVVVAAFLLVVPVLQWKGRALRARFSV